MRVVDVSDSSHIQGAARETAPMKALKNRLLAARALWSFVDLVRHPEHLDRVFEIADALSDQQPRRAREDARPLRDGSARRGGPSRPAAPRRRSRELAPLPAGTLGRTFADHMRANGLDPAALPTLRRPDDIEFLRAHLYETHDVWHAVTGFDDRRRGRAGAPGVLRRADARRPASHAHRDGVPELPRSSRWPTRAPPPGRRRRLADGQARATPSSGCAGRSSGTAPGRSTPLLGVEAPRRRSPGLAAQPR